MKYYKYGKEELDYLKEKDPILGEAIDRIGFVKRQVNPDIFESLISSIISQQISTKAALTVKMRLIDLVGEITPENIVSLDIESIQQCGMSMRKADYIKSTAESVVTKEIDLYNLDKLTDEEVVKELVKLKGIGEWTAEMMLIHSLQRPNILSYKDLAIRRGIMRLYSLEDLSKKEFEIYRNRYSPYNTVASIYLWELSEN
ncbi:MAG: hypothetical protein RIN55_02720 [Tissierellaceae bacterium]|nr:hypothetical protein [Tissierellaceae bacterium]